MRIIFFCPHLFSLKNMSKTTNDLVDFITFQSFANNILQNIPSKEEFMKKDTTFYMQSFDDINLSPFTLCNLQKYLEDALGFDFAFKAIHNENKIMMLKVIRTDCIMNECFLLMEQIEKEITQLERVKIDLEKYVVGMRDCIKHNNVFSHVRVDNIKEVIYLQQMIEHLYSKKHIIFYYKNPTRFPSLQCCFLLQKKLFSKNSCYKQEIHPCI